MLSVAERLYCILLLAYPARHRREYGLSMLQLFRDLCRDARRRRSPAVLLRLAGHILADTGVNIVVENIEVLMERNRLMTPQQHIKVIAHAGLPIVLGIALFLVNPAYMSRLFGPSPAQPAGWLISAAVLTLAGIVYFVERDVFVRTDAPVPGPAAVGSASRPGWMVSETFALFLSTLFLVLPSVLLVVLGPASVMVIEFLKK